MNLVEYPDREIMQVRLVDALASELRKCLEQHPHASFAVPGGSTPGPIFEYLSSVALDWARVHVLLTDERWVPEDDPQSNAALVRRTLLRDKAAEAPFHTYYRDGLGPEAGCVEVAPDLAPEIPISLLLLGMGDDMHTASLFPGSEGLEAALASGASLLCPVQPLGGGVPRVTLPAHALEGAMSKHLAIYGDAKRESLENARGLPPEAAPIAAVMGGGTVHWAP